MKKIFLAIFTITLLITVSSCTKEDDSDTQGPSINIIEPTTTSSYKSGDEVHFEIDFIDNDTINNLQTLLIKEQMGIVDTVLNVNIEPDAPTYSMHGHYSIGIVMHANYSVIVTATDNSGNEITATTAFHVMN